MHIPDRRLIALSVPLLLGLGIAGANADQQTGPIQCGIEAKTDGGMVGFRGLVQASSDISGSYSFRVASSGNGGSSDISQGGNFSARAGDELHLGKVMLSNGGQYDVDFEVTANGQAYDCNGSAPHEN